ncbi:MAG: hypothetical protein ACLQPN_04755, partial [Bryobacteraceae bacterium]
MSVLHFALVEDASGGGVAEISDQGDFQAVLDLDAVFAQGGNLGAGEAVVFAFEFFADADEGVAQAGAAVVGLQGTDDKIAADGEIFARTEAHQLVGGSLAFDVAPMTQQRIHGAFQFARQHHGPRLHSLKITLRKVVRQTGQVIHVAVGDA